MDRPNWAEGLHPRGNFYEGYVDNLQHTLDRHRSSTVTTYGVRRSHTTNFRSNPEEVLLASCIGSFTVTFRCI